MPISDAARAPRFTLHQEPAGRGVVVRVTGELDMANAPALTEVLEAAATPLCIVDVTDVVFIDSTGLRCLLMGYRAVGERGSEFVLCGAGGVVHDLLRRTGLDTRIPIAPDCDSVVNAG